MREKQEENEVRYQEQRGLLHPPSIQEVINVQSIEEAYEIQAKIQNLVCIPGRGTNSTTEKEEKDKFVVVVGDEEEDLPSSSLLCERRSRKKKEKVILALDIAYSTKSDLAVASGVLWEQQEEKKIERDESKTGKKAGGRTGGSDRRIGRILGERVKSGKVNFPYQPGLLAFREIPLLVDVIQDLLSVFAAEKGNKKKQGGAKLKGEEIEDDYEDDNCTLLCDGAGIAHPRFCGIACHLGVLFGVPSIGVAKNHLVGDFDGGKGGEGNGAEEAEEKNPPANRGFFAKLYFQDKFVGTVLRTQDNVRPIFVSPGHLISIEGATETVLRLCSQYRLPEPIRRADHIGRIELKRIEQEREKQEQQQQEQ